MKVDEGTRVVAKVLNTKTMDYTYVRLSNGKCWYMGKGDIEAYNQAQLEDSKALHSVLKSLRRVREDESKYS